MDSRGFAHRGCSAPTDVLQRWPSLSSGLPGMDDGVGQWEGDQGRLLGGSSSRRYKKPATET